MSIAENLSELHSQIPDGVQLVAVSKFHPVQRLMEAYNAGQRIFGENRAQELVQKAPLMPQDVQWHFIGKLQTNKVRMIMPHVAMIQSIDSIKLLQLVDKEAARINRKVNVLIQLHVAQETTKSGFTVQEVLEAAEAGQLQGYENVTICGVMGMATFTSDQEQVAHEFALIKETFNTLKSKHMTDNPHFTQVSMGMSDDWPLAVQQGSTIVRIGTHIFGPREY